MADAGSGISDFPALVVTVIVGATVLVLVYISSLLKASKTEEVEKSTEVGTPRKEKHENVSATQKTSKKKHTEKWTRESKQSFSHPWLSTSLKGHSGQILDMDFSSNGKFLASCADDTEELDPGGECSGQSSGSEGNKENSPQGSSQRSCKGALLSRRQKKNRVRRDDGSPVTGSGGGGKRGKARGKVRVPALRQHAKLNLSDADLLAFLHHYMLSQDQLLGLGFPVESGLYPGRAIIFRGDAASTGPPQPPSGHLFDVNAEEFVPRNVLVDRDTNVHITTSDYGEWNADQDDNSTGSSSPEISAESDEFADAIEVDVLEVVKSAPRPREKPWCGSDEKKCVRCGRGFFVTDDGEYLTQEHCLYHWGKLQKVVIPSAKGSGMTVRTEYSCCRGRSSTRGCTTGKLHVWNGVGPGINGPFDGYVRTRHRKTPPVDGNYGVYALDCEMCFTTRGLELTKVTVVASDGRLVYDSLVKPENYIIDYNTRFSGVTARDLSKKGTKSLKDVQNDLMGFINADTILVGHGLENDLRALKIIHSTVIDTSVVFPHYYGLPYRRSLKSLVACLLKREIQKDSSGHDSFEDARACIELMLWRVRKDFRTILEN